MNSETLAFVGFDARRVCAAGYALHGNEQQWLDHVCAELSAALRPVRAVSGALIAVESGVERRGWHPAPGASAPRWELRACDGHGCALVLSTEGSDPAPSARARRGWDLVVAHLGVALGLRRGARAEHPEIDSPADVLREQVTALGPLRALEPVAAQSLWDRLADGALSLVARCEAGARRHLVLRTNDPAHPDPRALTPRERAVLERALRGESNKAISYDLGVSQPTVSGHLAGALRKLGAACVTDLAGYFSPGALAHGEIYFAGETLHVVALPAPHSAAHAPLTHAEREVVADVLSGLTNLQIAQRRNRSQRTVANQIASVFRKHGINSRRELAVQLLASG